MLANIHFGICCLPVSALKFKRIKMYNTITLSPVLYRYGTSHTKEEHELMVFEKSVLKPIFGTKREEVAGGWKRLHNQKLHNLNSSPYVARVIKLRGMRWVGHVARMGGMKNAYKILVAKLEKKRPLGRTRRRR
jgi:hypothetical protein